MVFALAAIAPDGAAAGGRRQRRVKERPVVAPLSVHAVRTPPQTNGDPFARRQPTGREFQRPTTIHRNSRIAAPHGRAPTLAPRRTGRLRRWLIGSLAVLALTGVAGGVQAAGGLDAVGDGIRQRIEQVTRNDGAPHVVTARDGRAMTVPGNYSNVRPLGKSGLYVGERADGWTGVFKANGQLKAETPSRVSLSSVGRITMVELGNGMSVPVKLLLLND